MRFQVTKQFDLDQVAVQKVAEEFSEWLEEKELLKLEDEDERLHADLAREWVEWRNRIVR